MGVIIRLIFLGCTVGVVAGCATSRPTTSPPANATQTSSIDELRIAAIEKSVNDTQARRHRCWEVAIADSLNIRGTVVLQAQFASKSNVQDIVVVQDSTGSDVLAKCLSLVYRHYVWPSVFANGVVFQLPFSFHRLARQYTVAIPDVQAHAPDRKFSHEGGRVSGHVVMNHKNTGNRSFSVSLLDLVRGAALPIHALAGSELVYVAKGAGRLRTGCRDHLISSGTAIYIPKGSYAKFVQERVPAKVLHVSLPGGAEQKFLSRAKFIRAGESVPAQRCKSDVVIQQADAVKPAPLAQGNGHVRIVLDKNNTHDSVAYMGLVEFEPEIAIPAHEHPSSTEVLVILAGEGRIKVKNVEFPIHAGHVIQIPPGTQHSFRGGRDDKHTEHRDHQNASKGSSRETIRAIQFYTPSGPEQRFRAAQ